MEPFFVNIFWITVIMLWVALVLLYFILTNKSSLQRKGYQKEYIDYLRRSHLIRICIIAVALPLLILCSTWIVSKITGALTREAQLGYIIIVLIILIIPFKYIDERINQRKIRELAFDTKAKVAIDLNYKTLHLIFNPWLELILGLSTLLYGIFYLRIEQWIVYLFLLFPWLMYLNIRGLRYQTRPYLKDNYKYLFAFSMFSYAFFLFYFIAYLIRRISESFIVNNQELSSSVFSSKLPVVPILFIGVIVAVGCAGRIGFYLSNYRTFNQEITGNQNRPVSQFSRKLLFVSIAVISMFTFSGIGMITGLFNGNQEEVGVVLEKYILEDDDENSMYCTIELCKNHQTKDYQICCTSTFEELPLKTLVKFKCERGNTITEIIEY